MGPLERQSETAREYLKKKEELKTYDINMFLLEEERLRERIRDVAEKYETCVQQRLDEANVRYEKMKEEYEPDRRGRLKKLIWLSRQQELR